MVVSRSNGFHKSCRDLLKRLSLSNVAILSFFLALLYKKLILFVTLSPFPKRQILHPSKLKDFVDDNSKFDENRGKFSKRVENTGKRRNC